MHVKQQSIVLTKANKMIKHGNGIGRTEFNTFKTINDLTIYTYYTTSMKNTHSNKSISRTNPATWFGSNKDMIEINMSSYLMFW